MPMKATKFQFKIDRGVNPMLISLKYNGKVSSWAVSGQLERGPLSLSTSLKNFKFSLRKYLIPYSNKIRMMKNW